MPKSGKKVDKGFIPGIYNYCDRWCEQCHFTARCLSFSLEKESKIHPETNNVHSDEFWQKINQSLQQVIELLKEIAQEHGVDLTRLKSEKAETAEDDLMRKHPLARKSFQYAKMTTLWFDSHQQLFEEKHRELISLLKLGIKTNTPQVVAGQIFDAVEIIRWYQYQIHAKLIRALVPVPLMAAAEDEEIDRYDADGSTKVALIGIDRSIRAWSDLRTLLAEEADSILDILLLLDRLKRKTEAVFPNARKFIRPGFDDGSDPDWPSEDSMPSS